MSATTEQVFATPEGKYLVDPYADWARGEGAPIHAGVALDCATIETRPWPRHGVEGAICDLAGRDDYLALHVLDLAPGAATTPSRHLHEEVFFALSGRGIMQFDATRIEWAPGSLFSAPMNARTSLRNTGHARARVVVISDFRYLMSLYRSEAFLFGTPLDFPERATGDYLRDCASLAAGPMTRPNEAILPIALAGGSIGVDLVEIAPGARGRAERQMFGSLLLGVAGEGMTLSWEEGSSDRAMTRWGPGVAFAPAGLRFHQHFNLGATPLRFLRVELGSIASPMFRPRRRNYGDTSVYASGAAVIDVPDEDPGIEAILRAEPEKAATKAPGARP